MTSRDFRRMALGMDGAAETSHMNHPDFRVNGKIFAAMAVPFVIGVGFFIAGKTGNAVALNTVLLITVFATTIAWIAVTLATRPENEETLVRFYQLVRPAGSGWGPIPAKAGVGGSPDSISLQLLGWVLGCTFIYATLFGAGSALYGNMTQAMVFGVVWLISGIALIRIVVRNFAA